jgi:ribosomal protein S3AE
MRCRRIRHRERIPSFCEAKTVARDKSLTQGMVRSLIRQQSRRIDDITEVKGNAQPQ